MQTLTCYSISCSLCIFHLPLPLIYGRSLSISCDWFFRWRETRASAGGGVWDGDGDEDFQGEIIPAPLLLPSRERKSEQLNHSWALYDCFKCPCLGTSEQIRRYPIPGTSLWRKSDPRPGRWEFGNSRRTFVRATSINQNMSICLPGKKLSGHGPSSVIIRFPKARREGDSLTWVCLNPLAGFPMSGRHLIQAGDTVFVTQVAICLRSHRLHPFTWRGAQPLLWASISFPLRESSN